MLKIVRCTLLHFALILLNTIHSSLAAWTLIMLFSATPHCALSVLARCFSFIYLFQERNFIN